ncbi:MAG: EAL domain-containing protein [Cyanobacteria bacterium P01_C01_bin.89]
MFSILIVDDEPDNFDILEVLLSNSADFFGKEKENFRLHYAANAQEAIKNLEFYAPDLILLDVMMPGMDGIEACQKIKSIELWHSVPIIMVTALSNKKDLAKCLKAGADDFISKPVNRLELNARVRSMLRIRRQYQQLNTFNAHLELTVKERTSELQTLIFQDSLTGLPSRAFLLEEIDKSLKQKQSGFALVLLDCDQFQVINGSFGNATGNQVLKAIANRLRQQCRPQDTLSRLGEDEFCFLVQDVDNVEDLAPFINQLLEVFQQPFTIAQCDIFITACVGITVQSIGDQDRADENPIVSSPLQLPEELVQEADTAMYQAKRRGKGSQQIFDRDMHRALLKRLTLESDLQRSLDQQEFITYYQPIIDLKTRKLAGVEALVRWRHPDRGLVPPGVFIPCMEATGLIVPVGMIVLKQACDQMRQWHDKGWSHLTVSVNLSVRQFGCSGLLSDIDQILDTTKIKPNCLKFEITESAIMDNISEAIEVTNQLRSRNIEISIDDFGTGYCSLGYLHQFSIDNLKIDRSFTNQINDLDQQNIYVVKTIIALSKQLGLSVIAEGLETPEQMDHLTALSCEFGQGYLFDEPLSAEDFESRHLLSQDKKY